MSELCSKLLQKYKFHEYRIRSWQTPCRYCYYWQAVLWNNSGLVTEVEQLKAKVSCSRTTRSVSASMYCYYVLMWSCFQSQLRSLINLWLRGQSIFWPEHFSIHSWPPMSVTILLLHSAAPVHTLSLEVGHVTILLLHSWAVTLKETNGISDLYHWWLLKYG